ncbi:hypothetical protein [Ornithinimicrobium avium]|uniref:hypothetical protein n=1 Tax=Ornithinimicrobium avium TaxID=2283195 RepID=UPI00192D9375|nr:hypothetical protein [Ornithinimicrobium avium]
MIEVDGVITGSPMITLPPGTTLRGGTLRFGARGVRLTSDNTLEGITIEVPLQEAAILNATSVEDLGTLVLRNVRTRGQVALLAQDRVRAGRIRAEGVHVAAADVRGRFDRPHGFGVDALQGGVHRMEPAGRPGGGADRRAPGHLGGDGGGAGAR